MDTEHTAITQVLVPDWRLRLEIAIEDQIFGEEDGLATRICGALALLDGTPSRKRARRHALNQAWRFCPPPQGTGRFMCAVTFEEIWECIAEPCEAQMVDPKYNRLLHMAWRPNYDAVLATYREELRRKPPAVEQRYPIVVMLAVLDRLKDGRYVTIKDVEEINRCRRYDPAYVRPAWKLVRAFFDGIPEMAEELLCNFAAGSGVTLTPELMAVVLGEVAKPTLAHTHTPQVQ